MTCRRGSIGYALPLNAAGSDVVLRTGKVMRAGQDPVGTIQHELGHVVTLAGPTHRDTDNQWLVEGIAEYIGDYPRAVTSTGSRDVVAAEFRRRDAPRTIATAPLPDDADDRTVDKLYAMGHFAASCMAEQYGERKLFAFVDRVLRQGGEARAGRPRRVREVVRRGRQVLPEVDQAQGHLTSGRGGKRPHTSPPVAQLLNTSNSDATTLAAAGAAVAQSVARRGSLSCSPAYSGLPVHWLVSTRSRRWVARVGRTANDLRSAGCGAFGRNAPRREGVRRAGVDHPVAGVGGAVRTRVALQASTSNWRTVLYVDAVAVARHPGTR